MILLTQLKPTWWKPKDGHILKWPNGDNFWYDALMGQYFICPPTSFDGGDCWYEKRKGEIEDDDQPLPWVL
jgi:hypothetical protein